MCVCVFFCSPALLCLLSSLMVCRSFQGGAWLMGVGWAHMSFINICLQHDTVKNVCVYLCVWGGGCKPPGPLSLHTGCQTLIQIKTNQISVLKNWIVWHNVTIRLLRCLCYFVHAAQGQHVGATKQRIMAHRSVCEDVTRRFIRVWSCHSNASRNFTCFNGLKRLREYLSARLFSSSRIVIGCWGFKRALKHISGGSIRINQTATGVHPVKTH